MKKQYSKIIDWFKKNMPYAKTELYHTNPFQLLIAVILSAQCTDKRVNQVTPTLFNAFPTPKSLASTNKNILYKYIKSISYPNNKSKYLVDMSKKIVTNYAGKVPSNVEELIKLPGVGRKTANIIASIAFGIPAIAVDTHVFRVSNRIGLTNNARTPLQTEHTLTKYIPKKLWGITHHWLILHGKYVCISRNPHCYSCGLKKYCNYYNRTIQNENT